MSDRNYELDYAVTSKVKSFNNPRDVRALTEPIAIEDGDSSDEWMVHSASGRTYTVNTHLGKCSCFDHSENGEHCKHLRACTFYGGLRPVPIASLFLDDVAREILNAENEVEMTADDIDQVAEIRITGTNGLEPRTKWVDADGSLVAESQPDAAEVEPPAVGDDLDAERELVAEQEQQATPDGSGETCGAACADGTACENPVRDADDRCHLHDSESKQQAEQELEIEASASADVSDAFAAATDGGAIAIDSVGETGDLLDRVLERGDDRQIIVIVN